MSEKRFGYGRVSTQAQDEARQVEALLKQGIEREDIITDKASGKNADRPGLKDLLEKVRAGDTVVVVSIDRLGRNTKDVLNIVEKLQGKRVKLVSLHEGFDTSTPMGKCVLTILAGFAELEWANILERQAEGIAIAKAEGRMNGRPKKAVDAFEGVYMDYKENKISASEGARKPGIARSTWYRKAREYENAKEDEYIDFG